MKEALIIPVIRNAESELRQILRKQKIRSAEILGELLERELFKDIRLFGELTNDETEIVRKYMRAYVWLGQPKKALELSKKTSISVNWDDEVDIVERGYNTIANHSILSLKGFTELDYEGLKCLKEMKELTGIKIPENSHIRFSNAIANLSPNQIISTLKKYIDATDAIPDQKYIDEIYISATSTVSPSESMVRAIKIFNLTKHKPVESRDKILDKFKKVENLQIIEQYLPLFVDSKDEKKLDEFINSGVSPYIKVVAKLSTGRNLSQEESREIYQLILRKCDRVIRCYNIVTNIITNLEYLIQHEVSPPENISTIVYNMIMTNPMSMELYVKNIIRLMQLGIYPTENIRPYVYREARSYLSEMQSYPRMKGKITELQRRFEDLVNRIK